MYVEKKDIFYLGAKRSQEGYIKKKKQTKQKTLYIMLKPLNIKNKFKIWKEPLQREEKDLLQRD